jgi:phosphopantothenate synthetase
MDEDVARLVLEKFDNRRNLRESVKWIKKWLEREAHELDLV